MHLFLSNELLHASSCVCCGFFLSGRMACCIINVLVLSSQQGGSADHSPSRTNTCQQIKKEELSGRSVHQCVRWCQAWGALRGRSGRNRKLTSVSQSCSPHLLSQGSAKVFDTETQQLIQCFFDLSGTAGSHSCFRTRTKTRSGEEDFC